MCDTFLKKRKPGLFSFFFLSFFALRKRSPFGDLISTTLVFAHDAKRKSGTTFLPRVVPSLQPLFRFSVARAL